MVDRDRPRDPRANEGLAHAKERADNPTLVQGEGGVIPASPPLIASMKSLTGPRLFDRLLVARQLIRPTELWKLWLNPQTFVASATRKMCLCQTGFAKRSCKSQLPRTLVRPPGRSRPNRGRVQEDTPPERKFWTDAVPHGRPGSRSQQTRLCRLFPPSMVLQPCTTLPTSNLCLRTSGKCVLYLCTVQSQSALSAALPLLHVLCLSHNHGAIACNGSKSGRCALLFWCQATRAPTPHKSRSL